MKKSQSIFLFSGLVPLVAAPIAIVASCSDTVKSESQVEAERLNGLIQSSKIKILSGKEILDDAKLAEIKNDPNKLLNDYLDKKELALNEEKFTYNIAELAGVEPKQDATAKTISFKFRVANKTNANETYDSIVASVPYQYQATGQNPSAEQTLVNNAIAEIEKAHQAKTFKLKPAKQTIPQSEIDTLKSNPENFLTQYTDGLPQLDNALKTTVKASNFSVADKTTSSRQQQADKQQTITFKVTVSHTAAKLENDTQNLTFDFTLQAPPAAVNQETQVNAEVAVADLSLTPPAPNKTQIQTLINEVKILEKKDVIFSQGADLITANSDITTITWEDVSGDNTKIVLKFKVIANKWYDGNGQVGTTVKDLSVTITGLTQ